MEGTGGKGESEGSRGGHRGKGAEQGDETEGRQTKETEHIRCMQDNFKLKIFFKNKRMDPGHCGSFIFTMFWE